MPGSPWGAALTALLVVAAGLTGFAGCTLTGVTFTGLAGCGLAWPRALPRGTPGVGLACDGVAPVRLGVLALRPGDVTRGVALAAGAGAGE